MAAQVEAASFGLNRKQIADWQQENVRESYQECPFVGAPLPIGRGSDYAATGTACMFSMIAVAYSLVLSLVAPGISRSRS